MRLNRIVSVGVLLAAGLFGTACSAPAAAAHQVVVDQFEYKPSDLTVAVGDTVEWVNKDIVDHTATSQTGGFDVALPAGKSGQFVATRAGSFDYICTAHPNMKARLVVTAK